METKILLVNFKPEQVEKMKMPGVVFHRGYVGSVTYSQVFLDGETRNKPAFSYFFPQSIFEYSAIFINLEEDDSLDVEFAGQKKDFNRERMRDFFSYTGKGMLTIFLGKSNFKDLMPFGILGIDTLRDVDENDETITVYKFSETALEKALHDIKNLIKLPASKYITLDDAYYIKNSENTSRAVYWNLGNKHLGCCECNQPSYRDGLESPNYLVLPNFKELPNVLEKLLRSFADHYPKLFPSLKKLNWVESDDYYPIEVLGYDNKINHVISEARTLVEHAKQQKQEAIQRFQNVKALISTGGNELRLAVLDVLKNILKISARDADATKTTTLDGEDIVISYQNIPIIAEVKGTTATSPSEKYPGQVWKHIAKSSVKDTAVGCLIVNHDMETPPEDRKVAYAGEQEEGIKDIIYIDTRILHEIALMIIDEGMPVEDAQKILFGGLGRVTFNKKDYLATKTKESEVLSEVQVNKET